jgi:hypothetical protein
MHHERAFCSEIPQEFFDGLHWSELDRKESKEELIRNAEGFKARASTESEFDSRNFLAVHDG